MKIYFKKLLFLYFFLIKIENNNAHNVLLNTNFFVGIDFLSYRNFKANMFLGVELLDIKLGIDKKFCQVGLSFNLIDCYIIESFLVSCSIFGKVKSLQSMDIIGGKVISSFRTWEFPINIGISLIYSKVRPALSVGIVIMFDYSFYERFNFGGSLGFLYMKGRNIEKIFETEDNYYLNFLNNKLDDKCLKRLKNNRNYLKNNDAYYKEFQDSLKLQQTIKEQVDSINHHFIEKNFDKFEEEIEIFEKTKKKLYLCIKNMFKIGKNEDVELNFFTNTEVKSFKLFWNNLLSEIKRLDKVVKEKAGGDIKEYLNNLVLKTMFKPKYLLEIADSLLDESEQEKRKDLLKEDVDFSI